MRNWLAVLSFLLWLPAAHAMGDAPTPSTQPLSKSGCAVGGCSGQLCIEASEIAKGGGMSTCEYREEYACYKQSLCERQPSGQCGWTKTPEFETCWKNGGGQLR